MLNKFLIVFLLSIELAFGQSQFITKLDGSRISISDIDKNIVRLMESANVLGLSLSILNNNQKVYAKAYGFKNKLKDEMLDTSTVLYAASFSKAVFAFLTLKLIQEKVIDLDKPLYQYLSKPLSDYEYYSELKNDDRWKLFTARMCLSHTTGLPNSRWINVTTGETDTIGTMKIYFTPGSRYAYSG